ncbi:uncharacterized protein LOC114355989 isoform X2 [Ostrinia furnacalis]|uniref:uncharacterized protein LOC114355989 isoform X2 n=1 Tax=Ostrinia furnacalis TaxID=93504 RepID=UPI00103C7C0F|nr:uncharacterized protein LOC114355989 isoform X2 [Ostrinia furnacalis]
MEQAIATSDGTDHKRTCILITLNILGVIACVFTTIILVLWALKVIFPEPNISPLLVEFLESTLYKKQSISVNHLNNMEMAF